MLYHIFGYGRHGKDTVAEYFQKKGLITFKSSSMLAAEIFLYEKLKQEFGYQSFEECFSDRHTKRKRWKDEICNFNTPNKTKLSAKIFEKCNCYVGLRDVEEMQACKERWGDNLLCIWIDASDRLPPESIESCTVTKDQADIIIENNGTLDELYLKLNKLSKVLF